MEQRLIGTFWKTFVKSSSNENETSSEEKKHSLGFQGNEAKHAYEQVINEESESAFPRKSIYLQQNNICKQNSVAKKADNTVQQIKRSSSSENITIKVTSNTILKAVEQKDFKFLQKHLTAENVNVSDDFGWTPLMSAAYCGHLEIVEFLLRLGANKRIKEKSGLTAAQLALKRNYLNIVALLKKKNDFGNTRIQADKLEFNETPKDVVQHNNKESSNETLEKNTSFYCDLCERSFQETSRSKHEASTLHLFNTKPKLPSAIYGISKQNKGYQMLLNTGWDEEGGLGPSGKGVKYPVKTVFKQDRKGLGQPVKKESRITHFMPGDPNAVKDNRICKQKPLKKRDREKLLNREARKEKALRIALS